MPFQFRPARFIAALERRQRSLERMEHEGTSTTHHRQERNALNWALPLLREHHQPPANGRKTP